MQVLVAFVHYEANTFSPMMANYEDFQVLKGKETLSRRLGISGASLDGIVSTLQRHGVEIVPTIAADAVPGGVVSKEAYERIRENLMEEARLAKEVDGVCLALHGSMWVEEIGHGDGDLLAALRKLVGHKIPIVVALDMHATITPTLVNNADALVLYRMAPHADIFQTGQRAANLLIHILKEKLKPVMGYTKVPIIVSGEQSMTAYEPMASMIRMLEETDFKSKVLSSSLAMGMCWIDAYESGVTTLVVTDGDQKLAKEEADRLAIALWKRRKELTFTLEAYPIDQAIEAALADTKGTIFLSDSGDNPTGGGTTDIPLIIERLLAKRVKDVVVAAIYDPEAVRACINAGVGQELTLTIGGKLDKRGRKPLRVKGRVRLLSDGRYYREGQRRNEMLDDMGKIAVFEIDGIDIVLSQKRIAIIDPAQLRSLGIEPIERKMVVVKTGYLWPALQAVAARTILMLSPGATDCNFVRIGFKNIRRPIYPLDPDMEWKPQTQRSVS